MIAECQRSNAEPRRQRDTALAQPSSDDEFMAMVGEQGLNAALKWRDGQYASFEERAR